MMSSKEKLPKPSHDIHLSYRSKEPLEYMKTARDLGIRNNMTGGLPLEDEGVLENCASLPNPRLISIHIFILDRELCRILHLYRTSWDIDVIIKRRRDSLKGVILPGGFSTLKRSAPDPREPGPEVDSCLFPALDIENPELQVSCTITSVDSYHQLILFIPHNIRKNNLVIPGDVHLKAFLKLVSVRSVHRSCRRIRCYPLRSCRSLSSALSPRTFLIRKPSHWLESG